MSISKDLDHICNLMTEDPVDLAKVQYRLKAIAYRARGAELAADACRKRLAIFEDMFPELRTMRTKALEEHKNAAS